MTDLERRFGALPAFALENELQLERGSMRDYAALSEHHYRAARPATATRVLVLRHRRPTVAGRFLGRDARSTVVGVLVESLPALNCRLRDFALDNRYGSWRQMKQRAAVLNADLRCISRVVVHPQWRGLGLAVRLVRAALGEPQTIFTEALAAMGKVHPFFERAGMTAYHRPPHAFDDRLTAALRVCGFQAVDLALLGRTQQRIDALPQPRQCWLLGELSRWHRRTFGRSSQRSTDPHDHLVAARRRLLCEPVYYLHDNRAAPARDVAGRLAGVARSGL